MKVVLYCPAVTETTELPTWEPLQLLMLARMRRAPELRSGLDVEIVDGRLVSREQLAARLGELAGEEVLWFGITSLTCFQALEAVEVAGLARRALPGVPVVLGGWHATVFAAELIRCEDVDIVCRGQGEQTLVELTNRLAARESLRGLPGILWKDGATVVEEAARPLCSMDEMPRLLPEDFRLLDLPRYQVGTRLFYMSSVGCPYACTYCCIGAASGQRWLPLAAERVLEEIEGLQRAFGFSEVVFWDNVFFASPSRVTAICGGLVERGLRLAWSAHARVNEVIGWPEELLQLLARSGCKAVFIGVESGSQRVLDRLNKRIRAADVVPAFEKLHRHGINVAANYMVGLPFETYRDVQATMRSIRDGLRVYGNDLDRFQVFLYRFVPFPGTAVFASLPPSEKARMPQGSAEWAQLIHYVINEGMRPWEDAPSSSHHAAASFYVWRALLDREPRPGWRSALVRTLARWRVRSSFYRLPVEWLLRGQASVSAVENR